MRYYTYEYSYNIKVIGKFYPQINQFEGGFYHQVSELKNERVLDHKKSEHYSFPESVFLGISKMNDKSKLTDIISDKIGFYDLNIAYMILSGDLLNMLTQFNLGEYRVYHLPILYKKKVYKYYFLALINPILPDEKVNDSMPDILDIREGMYVKLYFSERIKELFEIRSSLGLELKKSIYI